LAQIEVRDLQITYDTPKTGERFTAVEGVTLSVEAGEFVTIVGASGCG
jgi:NitT/TauT family transport system ATP-binding protein